MTGGSFEKEKTHMKRIVLALLGVMMLTGSAAAAEGLVVMVTDSFDVPKTIVEAFEKKEKVTVEFLKTGSTGAALNRAILSKKNPLADVFFGVDSTFAGRALEAGIFEPYTSKELAFLPASLKKNLDPRLTPIDFGDICLNADRNWFSEQNLALPKTLEDLTRPEYKGLLVVENPATSSPGLNFLFASISTFGEDGYLDFWKKLKANDVKIVDSWKSAYWGSFSAASKGDRPLVVSYATSPAAEVHYAGKALAESPTVAILTAGSGYRQVEYVGILSGTKRRKLAEKWIDWMLSSTWQEALPLSTWMFPARKDARLPEVFAKHAKTLDGVTPLSADRISSMREIWIDDWTRTLLR